MHQPTINEQDRSLCQCIVINVTNTEHRAAAMTDGCGQKNTIIQDNIITTNDMLVDKVHIRKLHKDIIWMHRIKLYSQ